MLSGVIFFVELCHIGVCSNLLQHTSNIYSVKNSQNLESHHMLGTLASLFVHRVYLCHQLSTYFSQLFVPQGF